MSTSLKSSADPSVWWKRAAPYSRTELFWDAVVHGVGIAISVLAGGALLTVAAVSTASEFAPAIALYVIALVTVFVVSLVFNMALVDSTKKLFARLDQAAIFLLIAGTYTPILSILAGTPLGDIMLALVWGGAIVGMALKLLVPQHFGRLALVLYVAIGWSGILVFKSSPRPCPPAPCGYCWLAVSPTPPESSSTYGTGCGSTT